MTSDVLFNAGLEDLRRPFGHFGNRGCKEQFDALKEKVVFGTDMGTERLGMEAIKVVLSFLVVVWGLRLGLFLLMRILNWGEDRRFDEMRSNFGKLVVFWIFQAIRVWTVSLPVTIVNASDSDPHIEARDIIGWIMWSIGISILLLFISGIPLLEESGDKKYGNVAGYRHYKKTTSPRIPLSQWKLAILGQSCFLFELPLYNRNLPKEEALGCFSNMFQSPNMGSILLLYTCDTTNHIACRFTDTYTYTYNTNVNTHTLYMNQKVKAKQWQASFSSTMDNIGIPTRVRLQHADV
ncbi:LOW QUALITY PROTEIN: uncharacterized protein LOC110882453 [Helianthus annuus]|uniref:LOW QUALITY PROTEIN: uncharacterized protein LOC110882453 n=1 Tax=Helianthus annuus TaxID=4232 RepID=UPI001652D4A9|nr:LOW QUALITY PROTEIN: uncharacterized protein LOC110882453 [Helianthus annuus]